MGTRGLYNQISNRRADISRRARMNFLAYCDGRDLIDLCAAIGIGPGEGAPLARQLLDAELIFAGVDA